MMWFCCTLAAVLSEAVPPVEPAGTPTPAEVRQSVERSLAYLEKDGKTWIEKRNCSSCHHRPMTLLTYFEAEKRGFPVKPEALAWLRDAEVRRGGSPYEDNFLTLGLAAAASVNPKTQIELEQLLGRIIARQEKDGSWPLAKDTPNPIPPITESNEANTMWTLLALTGAGAQLPNNQSWMEPRDRALAWLQKMPPGPTNQSLVLRVLVEVRFGKAEKVESLTKKLMSTQNADGGWSQARGLASDAFATGMTLYALGTAGRSSSDSAIQRGWSFLTKSQRDDGSWLVPSRQRESADFIASYWGTGWATLGLMNTLPRKAN